VPRPLGPRGSEALRIVEERPGITVDELRGELGVSASRVWQIVGRLELGRVRRQQPAPPPRTDDLNVVYGTRDLPPRVVELREHAAELDRREWEVARPRIETHLTTYKLVVGRLDALHAHVVDTTDLAPDGYSRPATMWLMSGRCLGLMRSALVQVESGVCGEVLVTLRALHEATELLWVVGDQDEGRAAAVARPRGQARLRRRGDGAAGARVGSSASSPRRWSAKAWASCSAPRR
jgi:hypothetical protein